MDEPLGSNRRSKKPPHSSPALFRFYRQDFLYQPQGQAIPSALVQNALQPIIALQSLQVSFRHRKKPVRLFKKSSDLRLKFDNPVFFFPDAGCIPKPPQVNYFPCHARIWRVENMRESTVD
jgi:hypothetical protein